MTTDQSIELYPDEQNRVTLAWSEIQKRFIGRPSTKENLNELAHVATEVFAKMGFKVFVDITNMEVGDDGQIYYSPIVNFLSRLDREEEGHDHERHAHEVQSGFMDGVQGTMGIDGIMRDQQKNL